MDTSAAENAYPISGVRFMNVRDLSARRHKIGDLVSLRSQNNAVTYCIIGFKTSEQGEKTALLKALFNKTFIKEAPITDLQNLLEKGRL